MADPHVGHQPHTIAEHGRRWLVCPCGAQWAVFDSNRGESYEQVSDGDPDYHDDEEDGDHYYYDPREDDEDEQG
jgi:hypothetical protein